MAPPEPTSCSSSLRRRRTCSTRTTRPCTASGTSCSCRAPAAAGAPRRIRHSYTSVLSGLAARLTDAELAAMSRKPGFVRAFPERRFQPMTTGTPAFLGLEPDQGVWNATSYGEGAIIGFLNTGIDKKHPSFRDQDMLPPPAKWKGGCQPPVRCNNKLIGAPSFVGDNTTADDVGHGTHPTGERSKKELRLDSMKTRTSIMKIRVLGWRAPVDYLWKMVPTLLRLVYDRRSVCP
nr:subtilisin-like protease SBT1.4 isoform X2 [Setaria viridis]